MTDPVCTVCGGPGYSRSVEHENEWLCFKHYRKWLSSGEKKTVTDTHKSIADLAEDEE